MNRSTRTPAQDPLLSPRDRLPSKDRATCITIFLLGMIVAGLLMIAFSLVLLYVKGKMDEKATTMAPMTTTMTPRTLSFDEGPWKGFVFEEVDPETETVVSTTTKKSPTTSSTTAMRTTIELTTIEPTTTTSFTTSTTTAPSTTQTSATTTDSTTSEATTTTSTTPSTTTSTTLPPISESTTTPTATTTTSLQNRDTCAKRVIGYYTDSSSTEITKSQLSKLTHAVFTHDFLTAEGTIEFKNDEAKLRLETLKLNAYSTGTKVMISVGGQNHFSQIMRDEKKRNGLALSISSYLEQNAIDGVDLFWKWPTASDKVNYSIFVKTLREILSKSKILSVTSAPAGIPGYWPVGFDLEEMIKHVDFINIFSMDFYGPWGWQTGPAAPIYSGVKPRENFNVDYTMQYYACWLKETKKLNIVVPFDVRIWEDVREALSNSTQVFRRAEMKSGRPRGTIFNSRKRAEETGIKLSEASWDEETKSSYILDKISSWISTFEDKKSVEAKLNYVNEKDLGGVWIRAVDMDDGSSSLLDSVSFDGFCASRSDNTVKYQC